MKDQFIPKPIIRNPLLQTVYGSLKIGNPRNNPVTGHSEEMILNGSNGERLLAYISKQPGIGSKGTVLLIHGWEGSSDSSYIIGTSAYLYKHGYDILRLNLRDHGNSHHLNKGIFKSTLLDETFEAVRKAAMINKTAPFFIAGFSLGGNFALRIALKAGKSKIKNLKHIAAISPVIDPDKSTRATDKIPLIRYYFIKKWKRSLLKKQSLFPDLYDFSSIAKINNLAQMMDIIIEKYTEFKNIREYYNKYTLLNDTFVNLKVPVTIITSSDDPIIPVEDFYNLKTNDNLNILIQPYGGHNGFFDILPSRVWYHEKLREIFK